MSVIEQEVPDGYKQTEVGIIPNDWECVSIGELNPFVTSGSRGWASYYSEFGNPFVRITNMERSSIYLNMNSTKFVSLPANSAEGRRTSLKDSDILISITADIGICSYVDSKLAKPAFINQHIALIRFENSLINPKFIAYFLSSEAVQKLFQGSADQGAKAGMNLESVKKIKTALPKLEEQTAIANALSDVDALLTELEKLIAKKQAIKTATMQQLLTGKTRLPQFAFYSNNESEEVATNTEGAVEGKSQGVPKGKSKGTKHSELGEIPVDWEVKELGRVCILKSGLGITSKDINSDSQFPCYGGNGLRGYTKTYTHEGDFALIGRQGALCGNIQFASGKFFASEHALVATPSKGNDAKWLAIYLERMNLNQYSESSAQPGLSAEKLRLLKIIAPIPEEQTAIATILSDMDSEIQTLEQRLAKTRQIIQGMMQELLTGRTRLPY
ncbi:EcoKI restriction-modification system protein HsdS [Marinomonas spartinae]|uniref:EcoKI restriction-modification system protein HsdS n=1 Tax=Marinomonas spartinae TaxID=1792290 RepID=A0A1A8TMA0_9GAMM|nr:restriction endonuclease subunit S [Marinomonas spartinae]SBS33690.1 EcoKI restriction-modification system protein HsdS [Marinomonas spartinae]